MQMGCACVLHELKTTLIARPQWRKFEQENCILPLRLTARSLHPSTSALPLLVLFFCFSANSLTFTEFLAREQIFLITSHGDRSALQGKCLTVEERGPAAGCCAALFLSRSSDSDCIICSVIKKPGLDLGGMLS